MTGSLSRRIRERAKALGADLVGFVPVEEIDRYAGLEDVWQGLKMRRTASYLEGARSVIVLGFSVWDHVLDLAVKGPGGWIYPGEMMLSVVQRDLALYLQNEGLRVHAGYPKVSHKYLAVLGGLGVFGKNSLIVNRDFGPRLRLRCIITDAELHYDRPLEQDLCGECTRCIDACPAGALEPFRVKPLWCIVGRHIDGRSVEPRHREYEPQVTEKAHLMCRACQTACPLGQ